MIIAYMASQYCYGTKLMTYDLLLTPVGRSCFYGVLVQASFQLRFLKNY